MKSIGAYEAKTHLPRLLDEVAKGEKITITKHGVPVAVLAPYPTIEHPDVRTVIDALRDFRKDITLGEGLTIRQLTEEGRR